MFRVVSIYLGNYGNTSCPNIYGNYGNIRCDIEGNYVICNIRCQIFRVTCPRLKVAVVI